MWDNYWLRLLGFKSGRRKQKRVYKIDQLYLIDWLDQLGYIDDDVEIRWYSKMEEGFSMWIYAWRGEYDNATWQLELRRGEFGERIEFSMEFAQANPTNIYEMVNRLKDSIYNNERKYKSGGLSVRGDEQSLQRIP